MTGKNWLHLIIFTVINWIVIAVVVAGLSLASSNSGARIKELEYRVDRAEDSIGFIVKDMDDVAVFIKMTQGYLDTAHKIHNDPRNIK